METMTNAKETLEIRHNTRGINEICTFCGQVERSRCGPEFFTNDGPEYWRAVCGRCVQKYATPEQLVEIERQREGWDDETG